MRTTLLVAALSGVSSVSATINAAAVRSQTPYSCNAVGGVGVTFAEDMSTMHANFPDLHLYVDTPSHGFPPSYSIMYCIATVEFSEPDFGAGNRQTRFAIANVTWSNSNLTLEKGDNFDTLGTKIDLNIEVSNRTSPVHYPIGKDRYSANLVNLNVNPAVGVDEPFTGEFKLTAQNPNPTFTPCFLGRSAHALKFEFDILAETVNGGVSSNGWNIDFGLIYEECHWTPESDNWGTTRIRDWESCIYREASNQTSIKRGLRKIH
ncbi:hypothetical protein F5B22DRAFT_456904 [Xylaria bambusicola]|uniref:uncharacterized protein n=1 Tax=Xylaria bambusicola TaxID=326684 RepID=UPI0020077EF6|nr:uncharacterized protein F5B22DRAFT_456904 [Xylaria bambusicola]KAI0522037.1 hypothetical protein F5B22DRAFT_456904 [Xylaria bambusicola]